MLWFGYKKQVRGGMATQVSRSDRVQPRNLSQNMGNNIFLQEQPAISPTSPSLVAPLPKEHVQLSTVRRNISRSIEPDNTELKQSTEMLQSGEVTENSVGEKEGRQPMVTSRKQVEKELIITLENFKDAEQNEKLNLLLMAISKLNATISEKFGMINNALTADEKTSTQDYVTVRKQWMTLGRELTS